MNFIFEKYYSLEVRTQGRLGNNRIFERNRRNLNMNDRIFFYLIYIFIKINTILLLFFIPQIFHYFYLICDISRFGFID